MNEHPFLVDIPMCVYNHERYVGQAIEGVLNQKTSFPFRLLIGEDCSPDKSREIIKAYLRGNEDKMEVIFHESNLGAYQNSKVLFKECNAKYIALLDGDDYWTDPYKLQKQIDFLEANPDYSICFHRVYELEEGKEPALSNLNRSESPQTYTIEDLAKGSCMMHTPSVVFRNNITNRLPDWFSQSPAGDYTMHMLNAAYGKIYYMPEPMAVYRKFVGLWGTQALLSKQLNWYKTLALLIRHFDQEGNEAILQGLRRQQASCLVYMYENNATEMLIQHEPLVGEVLDLVTVKSTDDMTRYSTRLLFAGFWKKMRALLRHNPIGNRLARLIK